MLRSYISNRPLSPHLSIYLPQISSMFSIWHRISSVLLLLGLVSLLILPKLLFFLNFSFLELPLLKYEWLLNYFNFAYGILFFYHGLNGIRHLTWDLFLFLEPKFLNWSSFFVVILLFGTLLKIIYLN